MGTEFKTISQPTTSRAEAPVVSEFVQNEYNGDLSIEGYIENYNQTTLESFDLHDTFNTLPSEQQNYVNEVGDTIKTMIEKRGLEPTTAVYERLVSELKEDMGVDPDMSPSLALQKVAEVLKAYRDFAFIRDPAEKRRIFMKLARSKDSKEMDRIFLDTMEKYGQ